MRDKHVTYDFTTQLFFDEALIHEIHSRLSPYDTRGRPQVANADDYIYRVNGPDLTVHSIYEEELAPMPAMKVVWQWSYDNGKTAAAAAGGLLFFGPLLMILFRQKYPRWWFDFNLQLTRFSTRVSSYLALMSDRYPSTDDEQSVHLDLEYPNVKKDLNHFVNPDLYLKRRCRTGNEVAHPAPDRPDC